MKQFFLISGIVGIVSTIIIGIVAVSDNNSEISNRKEVLSKLNVYRKSEKEYRSVMKEKGIKTDSLAFFLKATCDCDKDSIALTKMSKTSNVQLSSTDFKKLHKVLVEYRTSKKNLEEIWGEHVSDVKSVENWTGEKREIISIN
jgi:hypothetical protein